MSKTWSPLQTAIFNLIEDPNGGNAIIEAVAGSGKTTTIVEGVKRARGTTIFLAFNKSIAEELKSRGVNARTFHSLTYGPVTQHKGVRTVETDKLRRLCDAKLMERRRRSTVPSSPSWWAWGARLVSVA